jgi:hypothetical protein
MINLNLGIYNQERSNESDFDVQSELDSEQNNQSTILMSGMGIRRNSTRQNQQFNDLIANNFKTTQITGLTHNDLAINSSTKGDRNIVFNKLISINTEGDLSVSRNINLTDVTNFESDSKKSLNNFEGNLIWGNDVVVTDGTLQTELESLKLEAINVSQVTFSNDNFMDFDKHKQIITIKAPEIKDSSSQNFDYSITLPSRKPFKNDVLGVIDDHGRTDWVNKKCSCIPVGTIIMFYGSKIPDGWLECKGQELNKNEYPFLYDIMCEDENQETFRLPKLDNNSSMIKSIIYYNGI